MQNFLVLEGPDGVGKSTTTKLLAEALVAAGIPVMQTVEPTSEEIGTLIRKQMGEKGYLDTTLLLLFLADRAEHARWLYHAHEKHPDTIILSDRYDLSTYVYQYLLASDNAKIKEILQGFQRSVSIPCPAAYFILTAKVDTLVKRMQERGTSPSRWENRETLTKVLQYYQYIQHYADSTKAFCNSNLWKLYYLDTDTYTQDHLLDFMVGEVQATYTRKEASPLPPALYTLKDVYLW